VTGVIRYKIAPVRIRGAGGYRLDAGLEHELCFTVTAELILIAHEGAFAPTGLIELRSRQILNIPLSDIAHLVVEDRKSAKRAAAPSYIGGGFGIQGAAEGMLLASGLRAMSGAFTRRGTIIGVETARGFLIADHLGSDAWEIRGAITEILAAERNSASSLPQDATWLDQLERVAKLRADGLLSELEFEQAKSRLLREK
jgi:hypothetical protein